LESKNLLDVGAGPFCSFCRSYVSHIYERSKTKFETDKKAEQHATKFLRNTLAFDIQYKSEFKIDFPEISVCEDARKLPFNDESFDIVTMGNLLDYFLDDDSGLEQAISESARVLRPNGYLVGYVLLHPPRLDDRLRMLKLPFDLPRYFWQRKKYLKVMEKQGLKPLKRDIRFYDAGDSKNLTFFFVTQKI